MSQSYSHQNYPHTPANRFSPPDRHQPYDSYGFQTQTNTRTSSVLIQQHAQSRPGAISPIQRERRPLPSPEMHGHHARASAALHSTTLPKLPASQLRGDAFVSSSQPRPLPPHRTMTTDSSSSPEPRLGQHVASNTGRKPLPHPPSTVSQTIAASINASGSLSAPLIQGGSRPESVLPSLNVGVDTSFSPRIVVLASPAGSSSLPSSPVKESGLSFTPLWKQHKRVTQSNGATSPQVVAPRRALPTPVPRANADTSVNAYNQLANSSADMSHHMLLARSKTINSFGSSLAHIPLVDSSEVTRIPSIRALHHPPQSPVSSWARSVRFGPVGSLESDLERPPPVPPRPRLSELSDETSDIRTNPVENPEPPAAKSPPLPLRPRSTDPPEIREPTPKSALPTILDATDGSIIGGEAAPISLFRSLKGKEKEDYPEEVDSDPLTQPSEKIATFPFQGDAGGSPEAVHPHDFSNLNTEVTEDITHTTERRDVDRPSHTVTNISAQSNARAPQIKRMTLPVIPTKKPSITPPVPGRASNPTPSVHFSRPHEPQSMAMRLATQALAEENRARSQQYLPQRSPVVQYDNGYDEEDSDSPSEFDEPVSPVAQLPSISISVDESNSDLTTPSSVPEIRRLGAQPPTSEPYSKSSLHEIEDVVSISIPIPQLSFSNDDETGANSNVVDPQYRSSITFSPTPSAGARVRKEVPAPSRSVDGGVFPNIIPGTNLRCAGCRSPIVGRTVSAMNQRWHPACFKCIECGELLEHVSAFEHDGRPYCHLDFHERFAPRCYHCKTSIADERFITLDDPALGGQRFYHELHFFCAECGDPFLDPLRSSAAPKGTRVEPDEDDVGFTVYKGHPYCEPCHVRLRIPRCGSFLKPGLRLIPGMGCGRPIRDGALEALGMRWHPGCFRCSSCHTPFEDPSFFQRGDQAYCDPCYRTLVKSEL